MVPPSIWTAEAWDAGQQVDLLPEDAPHVAAAGDKRRREFALGRACARQALLAAGEGAAALPPGPDRRPVWPPGVAGSITHTRGYAAAIVVRASAFRSVGLDAEPLGRVTPDLDSHLFTPGEQVRIGMLDPRRQAAYRTLTFCAKEAFYKMWRGIYPDFLDFLDVEVAFLGRNLTVTPSHRWRCRNTLAAPAAGRWSVVRNIGLAAFWMK